MRRPQRLAAALCLSILALLPVEARQLVRVSKETGADIMRMAQAAVAKYGAGSSQAIASFYIDCTAKYPRPDPLYRTGPEAEKLGLSVYTPTGWLALEIHERIRKAEPLDDLKPSDSLGVLVEPRSFEAPVIIKVVLQQSDQVITPRENRLVVVTLRNAFGAAVDRHSGVVLFDAAKIRQDMPLIIIAIPQSGANAQWPLSVAALKLLQ